MYSARMHAAVCMQARNVFRSISAKPKLYYRMAPPAVTRISPTLNHVGRTVHPWFTHDVSHPITMPALQGFGGVCRVNIILYRTVGCYRWWNVPAPSSTCDVIFVEQFASFNLGADLHIDVGSCYQPSSTGWLKGIKYVVLGLKVKRVSI